MIKEKKNKEVIYEARVRDIQAEIAKTKQA